MSRFVLTAQLQLQAPTNVGQIVTQIQNQLNGINVNLQVQGSAQAQRQIQQVTQSCNNATSAAGRMGQAFAVSIRRFAAFSIATRAVGLFTSTLSDAVQTSIDFERQLIKLSQVTGDSVSKLRGLTDTITGLSLKFGVSSQSLLETTTALIQAGISSKDTKVALDSLAKSALAPNFDSLSETTEGAIAILAQFKQGVGALEAQLGSINAVAGAFAVEAGDLIDVVRRTGGVFKASGGDLNELLALFTSVRATTRESAESIGTGLRTIFTRIQRPKTIEFLKQFGVELVDLNGKFVGPYEAVRRLSDALSGLGEGDLTFIRIAEELGGFRQIGKVLPLLQQFSTAQAALNVAQNAGNSLTKDAETAQAALAIRITKVKEEFLALVRGITETSSFQIMANTALNLASALIRIADAIKPLLPLLTAMAAINFARGIGSFAGNVVGGLRSGRTFNQGGRVHRFATGGLVPGVGNSDTVPAMLSPGEFVIRKSSVQKLGASNLAGMNSGGEVRKYAAGGIVVDPTKVGAFFLRPEEGIDRTGISMKGSAQITNNAVLKRLGMADSKGSARQQAFDNLTKERQASLLGLSTIPKGKIDSSRFFRQGNVNLTNSVSSPGRQALRDKGISKEEIDRIDIAKVQSRLNKGIAKGKLAVGAKTVPMSGSVSSYFPGKSDFETSEIAGKIAENTRKGLYNTVLKSVDPILQTLANPGISVSAQQARQGASKISRDANARATTEGFVFEGLIKSITGAKLAGNQANFDFPSGSMSNSKSALKAMFANRSGEGIDSLIKADAKRSNSKSAIDSIRNKVANDINANRLEGITLSKFAAGGGVGSDTVPAMLTPGEFVVNRASAQRIGYGNLNRMNKVGKYANGGIVQHFATGTSGTGVSSSSGGGIANINSTIIRLGQNLTRLSSVAQTLIASFQRLNQTSVTATQAQSQTVAAQNAQVSANNAATRSTRAVVNSQQNQISTNRLFAASMVSSLIQGFLPAVDENTSSFTKLTISMVSFATTVIAAAAAVSSFGVNITARGVTDFLQGRGGVNAGQVSRVGQRMAVGNQASTLMRNDPSLTRFQSILQARRGANLVGGAQNLPGAGGIAPLLLKFAPQVARVTTLFIGLAGVLTSAVAAISIFNAFVTAFSDAEQRKNKAIRLGNVSDAGTAARETAELGNANTSRMAAGTAGAAIGFLFGGPAGAAIGAAIGVGVTTIFAAVAPQLTESISMLFGGNTTASVVALAEAQAQATKTQKAFEQGERDLTSAMEDLNNGTITAAEGLQRISNISRETINLENANRKAISENTKNKVTGGNLVTGGFMGGARNVLSALSLGYVESVAGRNDRIDSENAAMAKANNDAQAKAFDMSKPLMNAAMREAIVFSKTPEEAKANANAALGANSPEALQERARQARIDASKEDIAGNSETAAQLRQNAELLDQQAEQNVKALANLSKEIEINRKAFAAMNLGLSAVNGAAGATVLKLDNFVNGLEAGASPMEGALATLEAGITGAAQGISDTDFGSALSEASDVLYKFGASGEQVTKFQGNIRAVNNAQKNSAKIFADVKSSLSDSGKQTAEVRKKGVIDAILKNSGLAEGSQEFNNFRASLEKADINLEQLAQGDISVFENALKDLGENAIGQAKETLLAEIQVNKQLVALTKQRIDVERNLVEAQKEALQLQMEGREVQAKYGGAPITNQERRANVLGQANAGAGRLGLTEMRSGSIAELQQRRREITAGFGAAETARRTEGALNGPEGATAAENQKDLAKASKDYIQTVRELIKAEEDNLKTIEAKNKLEKDSMESLISGDIEKFFQQQAAVGATAAIATGNQSLVGAFGAEAIGGAYSNIQRMQEAGVQDVYGQRIGGAGGLGERSAQAALRARGVTNPLAAQVMAGTTAEEEASKSRLRALGGELSASGQMGVDMATMELQTATMNLEKAIIYSNSGVEVVQGRQAEAAVGKAFGGLIYASMGKFIPRGTDTVPAMLTPGEFVVRRDAVNRGNNLQLLRAINNGSATANTGGNMVAGFAKGGRVKYFRNGSDDAVFQDGGGGGELRFPGGGEGGVGLDPTTVNKLSEALNTFNQQLTNSINTLSTTKFQIALDTTNVNVNLTGGSFLMSLKESLRQELLREIGADLENYEVTDGGKLRKGSGSVLSRSP